MIWILLIVAIIGFWYYTSKRSSGSSYSTSFSTESHTTGNNTSIPADYLDSSTKQMLENCVGSLDAFPNNTYRDIIIRYRQIEAGKIAESTDTIGILEYMGVLYGGIRAIKNSEIMRKVSPYPVHGKGSLSFRKSEMNYSWDANCVFTKNDAWSCIWELAEEGTLKEPGFRMNGENEDGFKYSRYVINDQNLDNYDYLSMGYIVPRFQKVLPFVSVTVISDTPTFKSLEFSFWNTWGRFYGHYRKCGCHPKEPSPYCALGSNQIECFQSLFPKRNLRTSMTL